MPVDSIAFNSSEVANKWVPYYFKPLAGTIEQTVDGDGGGLDGTFTAPICYSSHNCDYYYLLEVISTALDTFTIFKHRISDDVLVQEIEASSTGSYWDSVTNARYFTIDIGIAVKTSSPTSGEDGDIYKISLPKKDVMERRKVYHGGYSTFMRLPYAEGAVFHSDIIPCNLDNKNVTVLWNAPFPINHGGSDIEMCPAKSTENLGTNLATSCLLEWNGNPKGVHSNASVSTFGWHADETWQLGTSALYDVEPITEWDGIPLHLPASDTEYDNTQTGLTQIMNTEIAGRAGHAKIRLECEEGTGSIQITAHNQFMHIILMIS